MFLITSIKSSRFWELEGDITELASSAYHLDKVYHVNGPHSSLKKASELISKKR
jgi:hypothetical protein